MIKLLRTCWQKKSARGGKKILYAEEQRWHQISHWKLCKWEDVSLEGIFNAPKAKQNNCHPQNSIPSKNIFQNEGGNKDIFKYMKAHQEGRGTVPWLPSFAFLDTLTTWVSFSDLFAGYPWRLSVLRETQRKSGFRTMAVQALVQTALPHKQLSPKIQQTLGWLVCLWGECCAVFVAARGFFLLGSTGSKAWGFSHWHMGSAVVLHRPSCPIACGFPAWPGIEPGSPARAGGFQPLGHRKLQTMSSSTTLLHFKDCSWLPGGSRWGLSA